MSEKTYTDEEREKLLKEREQRAERYGIRAQEGRPLTPPADYPTDPEDYGDPVNYAYPIDADHIRAAIAYFNRDGQREDGGYNTDEWRIIGERIAATATKLLDAKYKYAAGKVVQAEEKKTFAVKVLNESDNVVMIGGYAVVFGGVDLTGDTFTRDTDFWLDKPAGARPVLYGHSHDRLGLKSLGEATFSHDEYGLWVEAQLQRSEEYRKLIEPLVHAGALGWSTGAAGHLVRREGNIIRSWPIVEVSLTPTPAEPRTLGVIELRSIADANPCVKSLLVESGGEPLPEETKQGTDGDSETKFIPMEVNEMDEQTVAQIAEAVAAQLTATKSVPVAVTTPDPESETKAFDRWLRAGVRSRALKASTDWLNESDSALGGYLVPPEYAREVVKPLDTLSVLRAAGARVVPVTAPLVYLPTMTGTGRWSIVAEAKSGTSSATYPEENPSFGQVAVTIYKFGAITRASEEMLSEAVVDVWRDILQPDFTNSMAATENYYFTGGTGSSQPQGILAGGSLGVTTASTSAITADEVIDLYHSVDARYRANAAWIMNDATAKVLRQLKDSNDQYLWQPGLREGTPDVLLGRPVFTCSDMPTIAANAKVIAFGNFSYYYILQREGLFVQRLTERYADYGQVGFRAYYRIGAAVVNNAAIKYLLMKAS